MGYKLAGFDVIGNCEIDPEMQALYARNLHPRYSFEMDVRDFAELPDEKLPTELFDLDVLDGSPPCSVFSLAGIREKAWGVEKKFREGQKKQRLDDLFLVFLQIAKRLQPKTIIAENVKGLITGKARGWCNQILKAFDDAGYFVQIFLLNSARMGVPQKRERVFFIGRRKNLKFPEINLQFVQRPIPFSEVRDPVGKPVNKNTLTGMILQHRKPTDRKLYEINSRVLKKQTGYSGTINLDDEPARTVTAGGVMFRGFDGLEMTPHDYINCQTFPQDYDFQGSNVQYVCGMSVPPVMMACIARQLYVQWFSKMEEKCLKR